MEIRIVLDIVEPPAGRLRVVRDPEQAHGPHAGQEVEFTGWLGLLRALYEVTAALAAGDAGRARDVAASVTGVASHNQVPWIAGAALRCQGLAAHDASILDAAVRAYAHGPHSLERALTCEDGAAAFAREGNVARAGELLDQAITIYERLDAGRDLARAGATLRQLGVRRGRRVTHTRAQSGWQSLTPSEQAVVELVAEGLSNPQIGQRLYVSRRTVQTHLAHVFAKLHLTSRAQLAAEAARHRV